jgi:subtilase family serine protease
MQAKHLLMGLALALSVAVAGQNAQALVLPQLALYLPEMEVKPDVSTDLSVVPVDLSVNKAAIAGGDSVTFKAIVRNTGTDIVKNFKVNLYLDKTLIYTKTITSLAKGASNSVTKSYTIPTSINGPVIFKAIVDPDETIREMDKRNNVAEKSLNISLVQPDLYVTPEMLTYNKKSIKGGDKVTFKATIKNKGTAAAKNVKVRLYVNNQLIHEKIVATITKTGSSAVTYPYVIPVNLKGDIPFRAVIDPQDAISELDEKNNQAQTTISIASAQIDLLIESLKAAPSKPKVGQQMTWTIKVRNNGNTPVSDVKLFFFVNSASEQPTATFVIKSLNKNSSTSKTVKWIVPADIKTAVGYTVRAVVDPDNKIYESNEANNIKTYSLDLTAPNLKAVPSQSTYTHGPIYPNTRIAQWARVSNDNVLLVPNAKVSLYYYLNDNIGSMVKIGDKDTGAIGKKSSTDVYIDGALPTGIALGTTIHVILKVDPADQIPETDETDNELTATRVMTERPRQVQYPYMRVYVSDEEGNAYNGATVKITNKGTGAVETKTTGAEAFYYSTGNVIFESRPDTANYTVEVSAPGYRTVTQDVAYDRSNDSTNDVQVNLDKKALVTGKVTDAGGVPLPYVKVRIEGTGLEAMTDAQGKYGFLLNGGTYDFRYIKAGYTRLADTGRYVTPLATLVLDKTMTAGTVGYVSGLITDDEGEPLANVDVWVDGNLIRVTNGQGTFAFAPLAANKNFKIKKPGYVTVEFNQAIVAGEEYDFSMTMSKPSTDTHTERGTTFVSWHQHEGTPANAFFIPEYNVDVWWGIGHVKMGLDFNKSDAGTKLTKLVVNVRGDKWDCHRVQGDAEVETSAIDIPITISAGGCSSKDTQINVSKVEIVSDGQVVWSDDGNWTSATDPMNSQSRSFTLDNLNVAWNGNFKVNVYLRVQKKAVVGTDGDGAGALVGYHLDKKLVTWFPQKPPTSKVSTSWGQVGGYLLGILDNPVNVVAGFTDLYTVAEFNQYQMENLLPENYPD